MDIRQLLRLGSQLLGRDYTPEVESFFRCREALGKSLNENGQRFVIQNWRGIADFMETNEGRAATQKFIEAWAGHIHGVLTQQAAKALPEQSASGT